MRNNKFLRGFAWVMSLTILFVLALCAATVSLIVGDWIILKTGEVVLAWTSGIFIFAGFLCSLGISIGVWMWLKVPTAYDLKEKGSEKFLAEVISAEKD